MMSAAALLAETDPMPYPQRIRHVCVRARDMAGTTALDVLLDDLRSGDRLARSMALHMALAGRRISAVRAAVDDPDPRIRNMALAGWLASGAATAEQVGAVVHDAPSATRRAVYRTLRARGDAAVGDGLIDVVRARFGDYEAGMILAACSGAVVARLMPELRHVIGAWSLIGRRNPDVILDFADARLRALEPGLRPDWWSRWAVPVMSTVDVRPERVLDLFEAYGPENSLPGDHARLVRVAPERLAALYGDPRRAGWLAQRSTSRQTQQRLMALPIARTAPILAACRDHEVQLAGWLRAVPPSDRAERFAAAYVGVDRALHRPADVVLDVLPRPVRFAEVRRVLALGAVADDEERTLHYTAFLPYPEAAPALIAASRRAEADERSAALRLLLACADRSGDPADALDAVERVAARLRNEQDPVRAAVLAVLATVSVSAAGRPYLDAIVTDGIEARDASAATRTQLAALAVRVLREHLDDAALRTFALRTVERLFGDRTPYLGRLDENLRHGQEHQVFAAVRAWVSASVERRSYDSLFAVTHALGRRAWNVPDLQRMVGEATGPGLVTSVRQTAIRLWLAPPRTRSDRVGVLVAADPSTITVPDVWAVVSSRRTDLVDVALAERAVAGPFVSVGPRWVPTYAPGVERWLPRQHARYADLLGRMIADQQMRMITRTSAISVVARLPEIGWTSVRPLADSTDVNIAEAALGALPWTDRPADALPVLFARAGDDRARVAMYAAGRSARFVRPSVLGPLLADLAVADAKVTSRKEAIRLIGVAALPDASALLTAIWARATHRDVRAAIVSTARQRLYDEAMWRIVEDAVGGGPEDALAAIAAGPWFIDAAARPRYAALIVRAASSPDQRVAAAAWVAMTDWAPWMPSLVDAARTRLLDVDDRMVWVRVVAALARFTRLGLAAGTLTPVLLALAGAEATVDAERDLPYRRRLSGLVGAVVRTASIRASADALAACAESGRALAAVAGYEPDGARLMLAGIALDGTDPVVLAAAFGAVADVLAGRPVSAAHLAEDVVSRIRQIRAADPLVLCAAGRTLTDSADAIDGLFAVALARCGSADGWSEPWRTLVLRLRRHEDPDVRDAAFAIELAPE